MHELLFHTHTQTDTQTHRHTDTDTDTHRQTHTHTQTHRHTQTQTDTQRQTHTHRHTHTHTHTHTHKDEWTVTTHTHTDAWPVIPHTHVHTHTDTWIVIHTHTPIHTSSSPLHSPGKTRLIYVWCLGPTSLEVWTVTLVPAVPSSCGKPWTQIAHYTFRDAGSQSADHYIRIMGNNGDGTW